MYRHCLAITADYKTTNLGTIRSFKHHAAADPDVLKGYLISLLLQKLQSLNDTPVQRHQHRFIQTINVDLSHPRLLQSAIASNLLSQTGLW
jgi:hypothetical protein